MKTKQVKLLILKSICLYILLRIIFDWMLIIMYDEQKKRFKRQEAEIVDY